MTPSTIDQFREAIHSAGLHPPEAIEADGRLRRFASNGRRGDDAGWYVLHGDGIPAGSFGDWRTGMAQSWRADVGRRLSPAEEAAHRARIEAMKREREAEEARRHTEAAAKAASWAPCCAAKSSPTWIAGTGLALPGWPIMCMCCAASAGRCR
jgi:putative DNA primase/helicase